MVTDSNNEVRRNASPLQLLKAWHLATLRKELDDETSLTPAGLINADKRRIEALLDSATVPELPSAKPTSLTSYYVCLAVPTLVIAFIEVYALATDGNNAQLTFLFHGAVLLLLAVAGVTLFKFYQDAISPMLKVRDALLPWASVHSNVRFAVVPEIIDRLLQEEQQHQAGERLLFDSTGPVLMCLDDKGIIKAINGRCTSELGQLPAVLMGLSVLELVVDEDKEVVQQALNNAQTEATGKTLPVRFSTVANSLVDMELRVQWSEKSQHFFASARNITDTKMLERARQDYVATLAHDIKTPLSAAWASLSSLEQNSALPSKESTTIYRAERGIERVLALLDELLAYERSVEVGRYPISVSAISTLELVETAHDILNPLAESKGSALNVKVEDVVIYGDFKKLLRVLENLIVNALKYTPENSPITVEGRLAGDSYEFSVIDEGSGVPREYLHKIFKRYERVPATSGESGVGLGLSICKAIVDAHHGTIGVESDSETYSKFWIRLPIQSQ
jgi:PAS domain S-box-containing protein